MRFLFVVLAMTTTGTLVNAQYYASGKLTPAQVSPVIVNKKPEYQYTTPPGLRMRNTGRTLTIIGSVLFVGGIVMVATADDLYYETTYSSSGTTEEGDPQGAFGAVMIAGGTGMIIPGIIFWSKGSKKYKAHLSEQGASLGIKSTGLVLSYRF